MKQIFKCYMPTLGQTEEDAAEIEEHNAYCAVDHYLETVYSESDGWEWMNQDQGTTTVICVDSEGKKTEYTWSLDYNPTFYPSEVTK